MIGDLIALLVALLWLLAADAEQPAVVEPERAAVVRLEAEQLELPVDGFVIDPAADLPDAVVRAEQPGVVGLDGTIRWADGSVECVTASPCDFAADGRVPPVEVEGLEVDAAD